MKIIGSIPQQNQSLLSEAPKLTPNHSLNRHFAAVACWASFHFRPTSACRKMPVRSNVRHLSQPPTTSRRIGAKNMASYVDQVLVQGERVVHVGRLSYWSVWHLILLGIVLMPAFGVGLILWLVAYIRIKSTELAVTTKRVIVKHGFIRRSTIEINLTKVESIQVTQSMIGRMFNYGTLVVAGTGTSHAPLVGIAEPLTFRKAFVEAQHSTRSDA